HSDPVGALEQAAALFLGQAVQLVKTGFTGCVVHGLMNPCAISSRVSDAAGSAICLLNARQAQQLGSRPAPLDELAHAGGEVAAAQAALLQAVADLLEAVDAGGGEALDPAALGGGQGLVIRPCLTPGREDGLQLEEQAVDHLDGGVVDLPGHSCCRHASVAPYGARDEVFHGFHHRSSPSSSAHEVSLKSGPAERACAPLRCWRFSSHSCLNPRQPAACASARQSSAHRPAATHFASSSFTRRQTVAVTGARICWRAASQSARVCSDTLCGLSRSRSRTVMRLDGLFDSLASGAPVTTDGSPDGSFTVMGAASAGAGCGVCGGGGAASAGV